MTIQDFDDILPYVGSFGPFQKRILLLSLPVNYFWAVVYMTQLYQSLVREFHKTLIQDLLDVTSLIQELFHTLDSIL